MSPALKRYYKVFISSTFRDLAEHRQHAIQGILGAGHMPVALENFSPENDSKRNVIKEALATCQFYVIILGAYYGTIPSDQRGLSDSLKGKSYTEIELELALEAKLPVLAFFMDDDQVEKERITPDWTKSTEPANINKYKALRERLRGGIDSPLSKPYTIAGTVYTELYAYFQREHPHRPGYIMEPSVGSDVDVILRLSSGNPVARDLVEALGKFREVDPRLAIARAQKEALAQSFVQLHGDHLHEGKVSRVFFESGSTVTYLARSLSQKLPKRIRALDDNALPVLTNNAFAYLHLWLCSEGACLPVPEGPPDHTYGGMYGPLTGRDRYPSYDLPALQEDDPDAWQIIQRVSDNIFRSLVSREGGRPALLLAAASGLQLTDDVKISEQHNGEWAPCADVSLADKIRRCRGFHVGSYQNKLFKRCYYGNSIPTIVFLHDDKVDCEVRIGKCHYLFDSGQSWDEIALSHPLSVWIACKRATHEAILEKCRSHFGAGDWSFACYGEANPYPIVIGHNNAFREACKDVSLFGAAASATARSNRPNAN
jgi:hypothetical protein